MNLTLKSDLGSLTKVLYKYKQPSFDGLAGLKIHAAIRWSWVYQSNDWKLQLITCTLLLKKGLKKFEHIFF